MIHILLMILKIIGIILLVILGLLLFVLLVVLFVPVRYKLEGAWHGKPEGVLRAGWFLHILSFRALSPVLVMHFSIRNSVPEAPPGDIRCKKIEKSCAGFAS